MGRMKRLADLKWGSIKSFNKKNAAPESRARESGTDNILLSKTLKLGVTRFRDGSDVTNNVFVFGGNSGDRLKMYVRPNLLQRYMSYVITDKGGIMYNDSAELLKNSGYIVKTLNMLDPERSDKYNPFVYISDYDDCNNLAAAILANDDSDAFMLNVKKTLLAALIGYIYGFMPAPERTFKKLKDLLNEMEIGDANDANTWKERPTDDLDRRFIEIDNMDPNNAALKNYETFRIMAGGGKAMIKNTVRRIIEELNNGILEYSKGNDSLNLDQLGDSKHVLYIIRPNTGVNATLPSLVYYQLLTALFKKASTSALKVPVHCIMNDFNETGKIYDFPRLMISMKKYDVSCSVISQNAAVVKNMYLDIWNTMVRNFSIQIFLGGLEPDTLDYVADAINQTHSKIAGSLNAFQLSDLADTECVVIFTGNDAFLDTKNI